MDNENHKYKIIRKKIVDYNILTEDDINTFSKLSKNELIKLLIAYNDMIRLIHAVDLLK